MLRPVLVVEDGETGRVFARGKQRLGLKRVVDFKDTAGEPVLRVSRDTTVTFWPTWTFTDGSGEVVATAAVESAQPWEAAAWTLTTANGDAWSTQDTTPPGKATLRKALVALDVPEMLALSLEVTDARGTRVAAVSYDPGVKYQSYTWDGPDTDWRVAAGFLTAWHLMLVEVIN